MSGRRWELSLLLPTLIGCGATASSVEIPEPMVFDLVRGLGAEQGELEVNVLAVAPLSSDDVAAPEVAPEVEYALADGVAFELELPFEDDGLYSIKTAAQVTFAADERSGVLHGAQVIVERVIAFDAWDIALLYIPAVRFDDSLSILAMVGVGGFVGPEIEDDIGLLANATLFHELDTRWTLGLEVDTELYADAGGSVMVMPQAHWDSERFEHLTLQFGLGAVYVDGTVAAGSEFVIPETEGWFPQVAVRVILEF